MNKRVYGVLGVASILSNWNADFTKYPRTTSDGYIFGSDKAFKYAMKQMWDWSGEKILYLRSLKLFDLIDKKSKTITGTGMNPRSLKERYEQLFQVDDLSKCKDTKEVLENLFQAIDVKNFGATFPEAGMNISITGAVQFGQGFNFYDESNIEIETILSPFRDETKTTEEKGEAKNTTIGERIMTDEAHYFYPFVINPAAYQEYVGLGVTEGYTEKDYKKFKEAALSAVTAFSTNAKEGCTNEFGMFVETEQNLYLPNLTEYLQFQKKENKNIIDLSSLDSILSSLHKKIKSVEVYYNPRNTQLLGVSTSWELYDIVTKNKI